MPVENERKFVLSKDMSLSALEGWRRTDIRQAYLEDGPRIRDENGACTFTYKRMVVAARELVETHISREDFDMLWSERATALNKTRFAKTCASGDWVVDFLRDGSGELYFVLAEVELPRGVTAPSSIAEEIAPYVPRRRAIRLPLHQQTPDRHRLCLGALRRDQQELSAQRANPACAYISTSGTSLVTLLSNSVACDSNLPSRSDAVA
jgi:CYTH domain-containing protein